MFWETVSSTPKLTNEASVEQHVAYPLLRALGFEESDIKAKHPIEFQEGRKKRGRKHEADYVAFYGPDTNASTSLIVVEAKSPKEELDDALPQAETYARILRAPYIILTNGIKLQIWQRQPADISTLVIECLVTDVGQKRSLIEKVLSKESAWKFCVNSKIKNPISTNYDVDDYILHENIRNTSDKFYTERRLTSDEDHKSFTQSAKLLNEFTKGAIIIAPSGYGKTSLAKSLYSKAINSHKSGHYKKIPIEISIRDVINTNERMTDFIFSRLSSHCPHITKSQFLSILLTQGLLLICDDFDTTDITKKNFLETEFNNIIRDYPHSQIFIFSRITSNINLPRLYLQPLNDTERCALCELYGNSNGLQKYFYHNMPEPLQVLCGTPLILRLSLEHYKKHHEYPTRIEELFISWTDSLLHSRFERITNVITKEKALILLSVNSVDYKIDRKKFLSILMTENIAIQIFDELITDGVIIQTNTLLHLQHDALVDYFKAKNIADNNETYISKDLQVAAVNDDSFFVVILMSLLKTREAQLALWEQFKSLGIKSYINTLRYRFDTTKNALINDDDHSKLYLDDIYKGIISPLKFFFDPIKHIILESLCEEPASDITISGALYKNTSELFYSIHPKEDNNASNIQLTSPQFTKNYVNLLRSRLRLDSGRILGFDLLRKHLIKVISRRSLIGGSHLANERLISRIRFLSNIYRIQISPHHNFTQLKRTLHKYKCKHAYLTPSKYLFSITEMLEDISILEASGKTTPNIWWRDIVPDTDTYSSQPDNISLFINEFYNRVQLLFKEIIETSFILVKKEIDLYNQLPLRFSAYLSQANNKQHFHYYCKPVFTWNEAGADVEFTDTPPPIDISLCDDTISQLHKFNRPTRNFYWHGFKSPPNFDTQGHIGSISGETPVLHEAFSWVNTSIKHLLSGFSGRDYGIPD